MIEEIEKKLAIEKSRLARLEASQKKCMEKIKDYEATIRVLAEINPSSAEGGKEKKRTAADYILQALKGLDKPVSRVDLIGYMKITEGVEMNENTVIGTLQRLRTNENVDCSKDNLWSLKQISQSPVEKSAEEDDEIPF